ncbi:Fc.00g025210.m01.CDS01 [Cosmosporella sp. VM-42]
MNQEPETPSTARPPNQPRETPATTEEETESPPSPAPNDRAPYPTHELEDLRIGDSGVQLLVSNHGHQYKAKRIEGGRDSWQCVGTWSDETIQGFARLIAERHAASSNQNDVNDQASGNKDGYGPGRTLGLSAKSARVPDA